VGSIAFHYAAYLKDIAAEKEIRIGTIDASPLEGLVRYYALR
jgi:hypothetical protein